MGQNTSTHNHTIYSKYMLNQLDTIFKRYEGSFKQINYVSTHSIYIILHDSTQFILAKSNPSYRKICTSLKKGKRYSFIYTDDHNSRKYLLDILAPEIHTISGTIAAVGKFTNELPEEDIIEMDGFLKRVDRIEILFLEQNQTIQNIKFSKNRYYYRDDDSLGKIEPLKYYNFKCVIDDEDRDIWLRIIKAVEITQSNNKKIKELIDNANMLSTN